MPEYTLTNGEGQRIRDIVDFARNFAQDLSPDGRKALVISLFREFRTEVDEVRAESRQHRESAPHREPTPENLDPQHVAYNDHLYDINDPRRRGE